MGWERNEVHLESIAKYCEQNKVMITRKHVKADKQECVTISGCLITSNMSPLQPIFKQSASWGLVRVLAE